MFEFSPTERLTFAIWLCNLHSVSSCNQVFNRIPIFTDGRLMLGCNGTDRLSVETGIFVRNYECPNLNLKRVLIVDYLNLLMNFLLTGIGVNNVETNICANTVRNIPNKYGNLNINGEKIIQIKRKCTLVDVMINILNNGRSIGKNMRKKTKNYSLYIEGNIMKNIKTKLGKEIELTTRETKIKLKKEGVNIDKHLRVRYMPKTQNIDAAPKQNAAKLRSLNGTILSNSRVFAATGARLNSRIRNF